MGARRQARALRRCAERVGWRYGAGVGEDVMGRSVFDFDAGNQQPIIEWRLEDAEADRYLRAARARAGTSESKGVRHTAVVGRDDGGRGDVRLGSEGCGESKAGHCRREWIAGGAPAAALERCGFVARTL